MVTVQAEGCAPSSAYLSRAPSAPRCSNADRRAASRARAIGDFVRAVRGRRRGCCSDADMVSGIRHGKLEGISAAPEGGAALHALRVLQAQGRIQPHHRVVVFNTGGALKYLDVLG